jgi:hypothetical protein
MKGDVIVSETVTVQANDIDLDSSTEDTINDILMRGGIELLLEEIPQFRQVNYEVTYNEI